VYVRDCMFLHMPVLGVEFVYGLYVFMCVLCVCCSR